MITEECVITGQTYFGFLQYVQLNFFICTHALVLSPCVHTNQAQEVFKEVLGNFQKFFYVTDNTIILGLSH